jgi:hypothetical protein
MMEDGFLQIRNCLISSLLHGGNTIMIEKDINN